MLSQSCSDAADQTRRLELLTHAMQTTKQPKLCWAHPSQGRPSSPWLGNSFKQPNMPKLSTTINIEHTNFSTHWQKIPYIAEMPAPRNISNGGNVFLDRLARMHKYHYHLSQNLNHHRLDPTTDPLHHSGTMNVRVNRRVCLRFLPFCFYVVPLLLITWLFCYLK